MDFSDVIRFSLENRREYRLATFFGNFYRAYRRGAEGLQKGEQHKRGHRQHHEDHEGIIDGTYASFCGEKGRDVSKAASGRKKVLYIGIIAHDGCQQGFRVQICALAQKERGQRS